MVTRPPFQERVSEVTAKGLDTGSQLQPLQSPGTEPIARPGPCHLPQGLQSVPAACVRVWSQGPPTGSVSSCPTGDLNLGRSGHLSSPVRGHSPALRPASKAATPRRTLG